MRQNLRYL